MPYWLWLSLAALGVIAYIRSFWTVPRDFYGNDGCACDSDRMRR